MKRKCPNACRLGAALVIGLATMGHLNPVRAQMVSVVDTTTLGPLLPLLRASNPSLAALRARVELAEARAQVSAVNPFALAFDIEEIPPNEALGTTGSASLELTKAFTPGLGSAQRAVARVELDRAVLELELTRELVLARAAQHLMEARSARAIARRLASEDSLLAGAEQSLRVRFAVGDARYVDVLRLRTERLRVESEMAAVITEARAAHGRLLALVRSPDPANRQAAAIVDSLVSVTRLAPSSPFPPMPALEVLHDRSGAARRVTLNVAHADAVRRLSSAERRPAISLSVGVQRFETAAGHAVGPTVAGSVTLPFTAGKANAAADRAAERAVDAARAESTAVLAGARARLAAVRDKYETLRARLSRYETALLRGARDEREGALAAYRGGDLSLMELLDFERAMARADIDQQRTGMEAAAAVAELAAVLADVGGAGTEAVR